jgi:hypothetical protein
MTDLKRFRKAQQHSVNNQVWNNRGTPDFTDFSPANILSGDLWRCDVADGVVVNEIAGNVTVYAGDLIIAMVDDPGELNFTNLNSGNWEIIRKNPITEGTMQTGVDGGVRGEEAFDNDYRYLCVRGGNPESLPGAGDGTAIWKKSALTTT